MDEKIAAVRADFGRRYAHGYLGPDSFDTIEEMLRIVDDLRAEVARLRAEVAEAEAGRDEWRAASGINAQSLRVRVEAHKAALVAIANAHAELSAQGARLAVAEDAVRAWHGAAESEGQRADKADAELAAVAGERAILVDLLRRLEWAGSGDDEELSCPVCGGGEDAGHMMSCALALALAPPPPPAVS